MTRDSVFPYVCLFLCLSDLQEEVSRTKGMEGHGRPQWARGTLVQNVLLKDMFPMVEIGTSFHPWSSFFFQNFSRLRIYVKTSESYLWFFFFNRKGGSGFSRTRRGGGGGGSSNYVRPILVLLRSRWMIRVVNIFMLYYFPVIFGEIG